MCYALKKGSLDQKAVIDASNRVVDYSVKSGASTPEELLNRRATAENAFPDYNASEFNFLVPEETLLNFGLALFLLSLIGIMLNKQGHFLIVMLFFELMLYSLSFSSSSFINGKLEMLDPNCPIWFLLFKKIDSNGLLVSK